MTANLILPEETEKCSMPQRMQQIQTAKRVQVHSVDNVSSWLGLLDWSSVDAVKNIISDLNNSHCYA